MEEAATTCAWPNHHNAHGIWTGRGFSSGMSHLIKHVDMEGEHEPKRFALADTLCPLERSSLPHHPHVLSVFRTSHIFPCSVAGGQGASVALVNAIFKAPWPWRQGTCCRIFQQRQPSTCAAFPVSSVVLLRSQSLASLLPEARAFGFGPRGVEGQIWTFLGFDPGPNQRERFVSCIGNGSIIETTFDSLSIPPL